MSISLLLSNKNLGETEYPKNSTAFVGVAELDILDTDKSCFLWLREELTNMSELCNDHYEIELKKRIGHLLNHACINKRIALLEELAILVEEELAHDPCEEETEQEIERGVIKN